MDHADSPLCKHLRQTNYQEPSTVINHKHASILITGTNTIHVFQNVLDLSIFYEQLKWKHNI